MVLTIYPRKIEVRRAKANAGATDAIGLLGYSGEEATTDPVNPQGEVVLFKDIPASVQASNAGRKKDSGLPQDITYAPSWNIFGPSWALSKDVVRDRDIVIDDQGYRYEVAQAYWNILGYKLICVRMEA